MKVTIAAVGRLRAGAERDLFERYRDRLNACAGQTGIGPLDEVELGESTRKSAAERRKEEADAMLTRIADAALLIALDETGRALASRALAAKLGQYRDEGVRELAFAIGGADGHGVRVTGAAALRLALGPMTLPHGLVRVVLAEQLYRAATILAGHPYHRGLAR